MKCLFFIFILFYSFPCHSQEYSWWNHKHNWDGVTHWSRYMIISPGFLGPNALPVPEANDGLMPGKANLEFALEEHYLRGDNTMDLNAKLFIPLFSDRVGLRISAVPVEFYKMDTIIRDKRIVREYDGKGLSFGDVYVGTFIQLVKNRKYFPDILVSVNLRTASGGNLSAARFTDSPGYYFDMSSGKEFALNNSVLKSVRPFALIGFYVWQTNREDYFQDDAILYGAGFNLLFKNLELKNSLGGYQGYIGNDDKPVVYTFTLSSKREAMLNYSFMFQQGIRDYMYSTFRVGCEIDLDSIKKHLSK